MSADDDSENLESEASTGQPDPLGLLEHRIDSMSEYVERLEDRYDAELGELKAGLQQVEAFVDRERETRQQALSDVRERLAEVERRTDMQRLVEQVDGATAAQRKQALLQHLERKARRSDPPKASLDKEGYLEALHHPDVHRTQPYTDMSEVAERFGDDICRYKDGRLRLDLTGVDGGLSQHARSVMLSQQSGSVSGAQTGSNGGGDATDG